MQCIWIWVPSDYPLSPFILCQRLRCPFVTMHPVLHAQAEAEGWLLLHSTATSTPPNMKNNRTDSKRSELGVLRLRCVRVEVVGHQLQAKNYYIITWESQYCLVKGRQHILYDLGSIRQIMLPCRAAYDKLSAPKGDIIYRMPRCRAA